MKIELIEILILIKFKEKICGIVCGYLGQV